jgi:AcrR family transcriptional regulator
MPKTSPQYEQSKREHILDGAAKVFARCGYGQATTDQICRELELSKGALYIYFKSKEELFTAVLQLIFDRRYAAMAGAFASEDPVSVKFEKLLGRLGGLVEPDDTLFIRLWVEGFLQSEQIAGLEAIKTESRQRFDSLLQGLLREGQSAGMISKEMDVAGASMVMMATADGLMLHSLVKDWGIDAARVQTILRATFRQFLIQ